MVQDLLAHGYEVKGVDLAPAPETERAEVRADLTDLGEALEVLMNADAVVHLANIPAPGLYPPGRTFAENITMNYNIFSAAKDLGLERVVWASSETTLGLPFSTPPRYAPVDEAHYPFPESSYALSKVASEAVAEPFARWEQHSLCWPQVFEYSEYRRLSKLSRLLEGCELAQVEPVGLR